MKSLLLSILLFLTTLTAATWPKGTDPIPASPHLPDEGLCLLSADSPTYFDCYPAFMTLPAANDTNHISSSPICTSADNDHIWFSDFVLGVRGECKIVAHHNKGEAHCIPPSVVREAVLNIFKHCRTHMQVKDVEVPDAVQTRGKVVELVQGRWYVDENEWGRKGKVGTKAWVEVVKVRDLRWIGPETGLDLPGEGK
ncbi:hypothetical protein BJ508DRAFT_410454 [Ascobolus immersus RN42]|uniref:Ecp2 effector protein domain-containing protein n=1 Tax=Ascobolus immersus RN42 TaxID=1160509 RepID=A0A3N4ISL1_ASCIM|nr:hypothetical protein BJ508DRAFT_410454 [Ascobolus immersus RN42]